MKKHTAQGLNDSILFGSVAIGSLGSGVAYELMGWELMNWIAFPIGLICLSALFFLKQQQPSELNPATSGTDA